MSVTPKEFERNMAAAAKAFSEPKDLLEKVALIAEGAGKRLAPVRTGTLRRSITHRITPTAAYVGSALEYAQFVHEGTRHMAAQPFLADGIEESRGEIEQMAADFGASVFDKVGK